LIIKKANNSNNILANIQLKVGGANARLFQSNNQFLTTISNRTIMKIIRLETLIVDVVPLLKHFERKPMLLLSVRKFSAGANFLVDGHGCARRHCSRVRLNRNNFSLRFYIQAWLPQAIPGAVAPVQKQFENG